ncbi:hypothetical protein K501DRAFT_282200 [Backusella circina FSU 941]|nr:hypothetical protein K501DRAFT_282200 [Backusella circina FSU 941]
MKLSLLLTTFSTVLYTVSADISFYSNTLMKRDHGLPYASLPSTTCATPTACSNIDQPVTCRCSNDLTTCQNSAGQYCWGSISMNSTSCPSVPSTCSSAFSGTTPTCLCNSQTMLCVDNANNYCYATITNSGSSAVAAQTAIPYASSAASSAVASGSSTAGANPTMGTSSGADPNSGGNPTASSGSEQISSKFWITAGCAVLAYAAIH